MTALRRITSSGLVALFALSCSGTPSLTQSGTSIGGATSNGGGTSAGGIVTSGGVTQTSGMGSTGGAFASGGTSPSDTSICANPWGVGVRSMQCGQSVCTSGTTYCASDNTCQLCTASDSACVTASCSDCCSYVHADNTCIASCTKDNNPCRFSDCADCCSPTHLQGICGACNINSDCTCPNACINHKCVCTPNNQPCAYPSKNCQDCCSGIAASGQCVAVDAGYCTLTDCGWTGISPNLTLTFTDNCCGSGALANQYGTNGQVTGKTLTCANDTVTCTVDGNGGHGSCHDDVGATCSF